METFFKPAEEHWSDIGSVDSYLMSEDRYVAQQTTGGTPCILYKDWTNSGEIIVKLYAMDGSEIECPAGVREATRNHNANEFVLVGELFNGTFHIFDMIRFGPQPQKDITIFPFMYRWLAIKRWFADDYATRSLVPAETALGEDEKREMVRRCIIGWAKGAFIRDQRCDPDDALNFRLRINRE